MNLDGTEQTGRVEWVEWVVLHFSDDMPEAYRPPDLDGLVLHVTEVPRSPSLDAARKAAESPAEQHLVGEAVAVPTDRFEDVVPPLGPGNEPFPAEPEKVHAQVYEIRPLWKIDESW